MKPQHFRQICVCSLVGLLAAIAQGQTTWYVDDDAPNDPGPGDSMVSDPAEDGSADHPFDAIQEGIDAAVAANGDDVLVLDGTYTGPGNKDLDFGGKAITVRSANGPDNCIIDCENAGRGFYFHSGETAASVLDGFTITNGSVSGGGGGGIMCDGSSPTVANCNFIRNSVTNSGGGMFIYMSSNPAVVNCTFTGNSADSYALGSGGGIASYQSNPTISSCTFNGNWAKYYGGGASNFVANSTFINCVFSGNESSMGGGVRNTTCNPTLTNCTISGNESALGGGLYNYDGAQPTVTNCILWGNSSEIYSFLGASPSVTYSCVQGGYAGEGNIDADPLFVIGPGGCYYLSQTAAGQAEDSPCVDAGSDTAANLGLDKLTTRTDEVTDAAIVDMGYHYPVLGTGIVEGDLDCDGDVDLDDLDIFVAVLLGTDTDPCHIVKADMNGDGLTNGLDIQPFVDALLGP